MRALERLRAFAPPGVWLAAGAGVLFRLWKLWLDPTLPHFEPTFEFVAIARQLASGAVYSFDGVTPTAFRLPLYPLFISAVFRATGNIDAFAPVCAVQTLLSAAVAVLAYRVARRFCPGRWAAAAAWLTALNPFSCSLDLCVGYEPLLTFLFVLLALALVRCMEDPGGLAGWLGAGCLIGVTLLCRSVLLLFAPATAALMAWWTGPRRTFGKALAMAALGYMFVLPWLGRNWARFHRVIPFEDGMGWHAFYQGTNGVQGIAPEQLLPEPMRTYYFTHDPKIGPHSKEKALENLRRDPWAYVGNCFRRFPVIWYQGAWAENAFLFTRGFHDYLSEGDWLRAGTKAAAKALELAFLLSALCGMAAVWGDLRSRPLTLLVAYMNIHLLTQGVPRYTLPVFPLLSVFAAAALGRAWALLSERRAGRPGPT